MTASTARALARALPPEPVAPRSALVAQIREAPRICVVRGPLGSGKTALAALAAREEAADGRRVIWLDVTASENADTVMAQLHDALPANLERTPTTLVLENLDRSDDPALAVAIVDFAAIHPELRLIVTTRRRLALESVHTRARVPVVLVGPDLSLSPEGVAALLPDRAPSADVVRRLLIHTGGHALTLRMLLLTLHDRNTHPGLVPSDQLRSLVTRLAREILEALVEPDELARLSRLAVPGHLTISIADVTTEDAAAVMARAEALGIGAWHQEVPLGNRTDMFVIPRPLRGALLAEFRAREPDVAGVLTRAVTEAALERGDLLVAAFAAVEAHDAGLLDRVFRAGWTHLRDVDVTDLADATIGVDDWQLEGYPTLALALALAMRLQPARAHLSPGLFDVAARSVALVSPEDPSDRAYLETVQSMALRHLGDFERAREAGARALETIRAAQRAGDPVAELGFNLRNIAMAYFLAGDTGSAVSLMEEAHAAERPGAPSAVLTLVLRALVLAWAGEITRAEALVADLPTRTADVAALGSYAGRALVDARSIIALERDDRDAYEEAQETLADLPAEVREFVGVEATYQATRASYAGDVTGAQAIIDHALAGPASRLIATAWAERLSATRAFIGAALGAPLSAPLAEGPRGPADEDDLARLMRAAALVAGGHLEAAEAIVHDQRRTDPPDVAMQMFAALLAAILAVRAGNTTAAQRHVARAATLGREHGSRRVWLTLTVADRALLEGLAPGSAPTNLETPFPEMLGAGAPGTTGLTTRERVVLRQLAWGASTRETADALDVSVNTVKTQLRSLYRKLGVTSREDALRRARELELI